MYGVIYKATNNINNKVYIGQTKNFRSRKLNHKSYYLKRKCPFYSAIKKYGWENFKWEIIDEADSREELNKKEIFWIKNLNSIFPSGYNLKEGGHNGGAALGKNNHRYINLSIIKIEKMFNEKMSVAQIAKTLRVSKSTILNRLNSLGYNLSRKRTDIDNAELIYKFVNEKISCTAIAKIFNTSCSAIKKRLNDLGIDTKYKKIKFEQEQEIIDMYTIQKKSTRQIAKKFNISREPIRRLLKQHSCL